MASSESFEACFEPSKLVIGRVVADLLDIDADELDWNKSFILLGGDSILAIDFIVRCRDEGIQVDMKELLTAKSLATLAGTMDRNNTGAVHGVYRHANGVDGHANGVDRHANGVNGHANGTKAHVADTTQDSSDGLTASTAAVPRRLRFASMDLPHDKEFSIISTALERIVARHSALRSTWSISSRGHWTLTPTIESTSKGRPPFHLTEISEAKTRTESSELLRNALLSPGSPSFGCLVMPSDTLRTGHTIVFAADTTLVDALSMRLVLYELGTYLDGRRLEPSSDFQYSDWVAQESHGRSVSLQYRKRAQSLLKHQLEEANVTKSKSTANSSTLESNGHAEGVITFKLCPSTAEKLFATQTHTSLRTSPVDIVNAALSHIIRSHYLETKDVIILKTVYSVREQQSIPLDSIGCYELEMEMEVPAPESQESLTHVVRRARDSRAGFSNRDPMERRAESTTTIYVDCTHLQTTEHEASIRAQWFSDPVVGNAPRVSVTMRAGQAEVSLHPDNAILNHDSIANDLQRCFEEIANELVRAPQMATIHEFPLIRWQYSMLDDLTTELQSHNMALGDIECIAPCSAVQENFLVSQAINHDSYVSRVSMTLRSNLVNDARRPATESIVDAWKETVKRHAVLRTTFIQSRDRPGKSDQLVLRPMVMPPRVIVCSSPNDPRAVPALMKHKFESPQRLIVYEMSTEELRLDLEISHALVDGHSAKILLHDFRASYLGVAYFSEHPPLPYTVVSSHQQVSLSTEEASAGANYWTSYLNGASEAHLPLITNNPSLHRLETAYSTLPLSKGRLRAICGQLSITPANLFHVAWALAIRRIILSDTITFSYIVSGRNSNIEDIDTVVGPLINTLPCALTLTAETTVANALCMAKQDWQDGLQFQNINIADLPAAKTRSLKQLGNTLLSVEREATISHVFTEGSSMTIDARTSATDVRSSSFLFPYCTNETTV
jgi:aryl carrier-like protein